MSKSPTFLDPFDRSRLPADLRQRASRDRKQGPQLRDHAAAEADRLQRVKWLAEAADALLEGRKVPQAAALFLASALSAWLAEGGALEKHLRVVAPKGSQLTPAALAAKRLHPR
jgi:hypothetical protein